MSNVMKRLMVWMAAIMFVVALSNDAFGQKRKKKKKKGDLGKGDVVGSIEDKSSKVKGVDERSEEEKAAAEAERKKATEVLEKGDGTQVSAEAATGQLDVDPARIDEILKDLESDNREIVEEYQKLLNKDPTNAKAPDWLFRIAEFNWDIAQYKHLRSMREWSAEIDALESQGVEPEEFPQPPKPVFDDSLEYYKKIVASHGSYERMDEVLYKLGDGLIRAGKAKEGVGYLHRLTQAYKDSQYLDRVYLSLGEYYFEKRQVGTAQAAYEVIVTNHSDSQVFNYAQYKLGWTYFNTGDDVGIRNAIETFKKVVEHLDKQYAQYMDENGVIDEDKLPVGEVSFRNQAINDLIVAFAEVPDGWKEAREYFGKKLTDTKLRQKMEMFAELMGEKGQNVDRIDIYRWLQGKDPNHPSIPKYAERIIDSYFNENQLEMIEGVTREFIDTFAPDGAWARANKNNAEAYERARVFAEDKLYSLAATNLLEATKAIERGDEKEANQFFADARRDHETFLERYPESQYAYDMNFYYAYILDENSDRKLNELKDKHSGAKFVEVAKTEALPDLRAAAQQYQKVIELRDKVPEGGEDQTRVSANRQVFVYANILQTSDPAWSIEASGDAKNFKVETKDSETKEEEPLTEPEIEFVKSAGQYAELFPQHEDTPGFLWRSAEIFRSRYHYDDAALRFDDLVSNFPDHEYAGQAVGSMFALFNKAENWPKIEYWAEWLIERKNFKVYKKQELEDAIGYSIGQQAEDLLEEKKYRESAEKLYTLKSRFPDRHELVAPAIFSTANIYRDGKMVAEAIQKYDEFLASYPKREEAPMANFQAALLFERKTDFGMAAEKFEAMPEVVAIAHSAEDAPPEPKKKGKKKEEPKKEETAADDKDAPDYKKLDKENTEIALFNAITIREGLEEYDKAIANAKRYLELYPEGKWAEGTVYHLAEIYQKAEMHKEAIAQFEAYLNAYTDNKPVRLSARLHIAKEYAVVGARGVIKDQDRQFEKMDALFAKMTPEEQASSRILMAEVRFIQAERNFQDFVDVKLEFPVKTLRKRIKEKADKRKLAEEAYRAVIDMKVARWSSAAAYRVGEMSINFRDEFKALPIPPEIENDPDAVDEYVAWIEDELIYPAEDAAIKGFEYALTLAHDLKVYNEWSRKSAEQLSALNPDAFPVTGEKGVVTEHSDDMMPMNALITEAEIRPSKKRDDAKPAGEGGAEGEQPSAQLDE